jgi:hypothetical protein
MEIKQDEDKTVYKDLQEIAEDLPDHSPRFVLLSYPLTLVSGRLIYLGHGNRNVGLWRTLADCFVNTAFWTVVGSICFAILPSSYMQRYNEDDVLEFGRVDEEYSGS